MNRSVDSDRTTARPPRVLPPGRRRRASFALPVALLLVAWLAGPALAQPATMAPNADERCLLEALRRAAPDASVASVRASCAASAVAAPEHKPDAEDLAANNAAVRLGQAAISDSPIQRRLAEESRLWFDRIAFIPHRPNYALPFAQGGNLTGGDVLSDEALGQAEFKFQVSFKVPLTAPAGPGEPELFFAYTGQAWWQAYQAKRSSPFREYNHDPEVFVRFRSEIPVLGWTERLSSFGFEHVSNGRAESGSRSWNRLFAQFEFDRGRDWWLALRGWWRIPERAKTGPSQASGDDNPEITRYLGNGELRFGHLGERWNWDVMLRPSLRSGGRNAAEFNLSYPTGFNPRARWYLQYFNGYGESLIDYDRRIQRLGIGLMLNDWY